MSVFTLVAISFERYGAVSKPLATYSNSTPKKATKILCGVWLLSLLPVIPSLCGTRYTAIENRSSVGAHCAISFFTTGLIWKIFYILIFVIQFILPLSFMMIFFVKTLQTLQEQIKNLGVLLNSQIGALHLIKQREKTLFTIVIVIASFFSLWTPSQIVFKLYQFDIVTSWNSTTTQVTVVLCFLSRCVNPVRYNMFDLSRGIT